MCDNIGRILRKRIALAGILAAVAAGAQTPSRLATTAEALVAAPLFFHGKQIVILQAVKETGTLTELDGTAKPVYIFWKDRPGRSGGELRGEFWDLGRMQDGDSRLSTYNFGPVLEAANGGRWPGRDQIFVILGAALVDTSVTLAPTLRAIALAPGQFENRGVTVSGRFRGRNLYGDLPQALGKSKWDFVLQSADGAVWVSGLRPKGRDFDLDPAARVDTGRWLEVSGTVHREGPSVWIACESLRQTTAPTEAPVEVTVPLPPEPPPKVIFSAPVAEETDVPLAAPVRLQFSRDMDGRTFRDHVRIRYTGRNAPPTTPPPPFTLTYNDGTRALEIRFKGPLERFQTVTIDLLDGIAATDRQVMAPFSLTFTTGG